MLENINYFMSPAVIVILTLTGIFFTVRLGFFQIKNFKSVITAPVDFKSRKGISSFSAMSTALAGTLGIGNIIGVATAVCMGGPGAVFYMWISAFFGMATKFAEITLSLIYKEKRDNKYLGGPMFYLKRTDKSGALSVIFCLACILSSTVGSGNVAQCASAAKNIMTSFSLPPALISAAFTAAVYFLVNGGIEKISKIMQVVTPVMTFLFLASMLWILFGNIEKIPFAFRSIFEEAFNFKSFFAGAAGYNIASAIRYGVSRGLFSNEAGMGTSPIIYGATGGNPVKQGLCGAFEVFVDTIILAALTGIVIICCGGYKAGEENALTLINSIYINFFGKAGGVFITLIITAFAVSTVPGWYYYGSRACGYLVNENKNLISFYKFLFLLSVFASPFIRAGDIFPLADFCNYLMIFVNITAVISMRKEIIRYKKLYFGEKN